MIFSTVIYFAILTIFSLFTTGKTDTFDETANGLPSTIDLSQKPEGVITINTPSGLQWFEVSAIADMNNDGLKDIICTGKTNYLSENNFTPVIYVIYGRRDTAIEIDIQRDNLTAQIEWNGHGKIMDQVKCGDINGDGFADILFRRIANASNEIYKISFILSNKNLHGKMSLNDGSPGLISIYADINPWSSIRQLKAYEVADINGDGKDDVILSYPYKIRDHVDFIGGIYIIFSESQMPPEIDAESTNLKVTKINGDTLYQELVAVPSGYGFTAGGFRNFAFGDLNGDHKTDMAFDGGANRMFSLLPPESRNPSVNYANSYIIYSAILSNSYYTQQPLNLDEKKVGISILSTLTTAQGGEYSYDFFNIPAIFDINGDGYDDLFISYPFMPSASLTNSEGKGKIKIFYGSPDFIFSGNIDLFKKNVTKIIGEKNGTNAGQKIVFGDVNGDGYNDFMISEESNKFHLLFGKNVFPDSITLNQQQFAFGSFIVGGQVVACGDFNGDGYDDIICNTSNGIKIILGNGLILSLGTTFSTNLAQSIKSKYHFKFSNESNFHFRFTQGGPNYTSKLYLTNFGNRLPDSLNTIPSTQKVVSFIQAELTNMSTLYTYQVQCSIDYTDSSLTASGIKEQDLIISTWNEQNSKWEKLQTTVDTTLNRATFEVEHLSLFALTDKNDSIMTDITENSASIPLTFELSQNYPNPFNPVTTIKYQLPKSSQMILKIYNILGQEVKTIVDHQLPAGTHEVRWDGTDKFGNKVASGIYIYRMETKTGYVKTRKMVFLK